MDLRSKRKNNHSNSSNNNISVHNSNSNSNSKSNNNSIINPEENYTQSADTSTSSNSIDTTFNGSKRKREGEYIPARHTNKKSSRYDLRDRTDGASLNTSTNSNSITNSNPNTLTSSKSNSINSPPTILAMPRDKKTGRKSLSSNNQQDDHSNSHSSASFSKHLGAYPSGSAKNMLLDPLDQDDYENDLVDEDEDLDEEEEEQRQINEEKELEDEEQDDEDDDVDEDEEEVDNEDGLNEEDVDLDQDLSKFRFRHHSLFRPAAFGTGNSSFRSFSVNSGYQNKLKKILVDLKRFDDPTIQLVALQELAEILSIATEDTLSGYISPDAFIKELVTLTQPSIYGEENPEMMLLACRCLANLMEALPSTIANVVYGGAVPALCQKLLEIQYIDLAEQALSTLEKISVDYPAAIVRDGGLSACLSYLDFFSTIVQRTAVTTAANCCRNIPSECFISVLDIMPVIQSILTNSDHKVVEQGCLCVYRIVDSFKNKPDQLEKLFSPELIRSVINLLVPTSASTVGDSIQTQFLRTLGIAARSSPKLAVQILKEGIGDCLYVLMTGVSPPMDAKEVQENNNAVMMMQVLIHRSKEQVSETLNVIYEMLPGIKSSDTVIELGRTPNVRIKSDKEIKEHKKLLASQQSVLKRFVQVLLPVLLVVYTTIINLRIRQRVLATVLHMLIHLDGQILVDVLKYIPFSSFLGSILSQQDDISLVIAGFQIVDLTMKKMPNVYSVHFEREGVVHEISMLANLEIGSGLTSKETIANNKNEDNTDVSKSYAPMAETTLVETKLEVENQKHLTWLKQKSIAFISNLRKNPLDEQAVSVLNTLKGYVKKIESSTDIKVSLEALSSYFANSTTSISSYELWESGLIQVLATRLDSDLEVRSLFKDVFLRSSGHSSYSILISKLQELLGKSEKNHIFTVNQEHNDPSSRQSSGSLSKQLRLKLVCLDDSIPKHFRTLMVSIYGIASFRNLDDYLRPRIAASQSLTRLESGTASFASALRDNSALSDVTGFTSTPVASENKSISKNLRRSSRSKSKSGKESVVDVPENDTVDDINENGADESEDFLEYMDEKAITDPEDMDDVDEVMDDIDDELMEALQDNDSPVHIEVNSDSSKTSNIKSTRESESKPDVLDEGKSCKTPSNVKHTSYAAALKSESSNWHIEFLVGQKVASKNSTIYGEIHKGNLKAEKLGGYSGSWSSVYVIHFRKVESASTVPTKEHNATGVTKFSSSEISDALDKSGVFATILQLLKTLHTLQTSLPKQEQLDNAFVNSKLTAKLNRQLEEPLIVASSCLPDWTFSLVRTYPFLFPFETRYLFLQCTSFGYPRSISRWSASQQNNSNSDRHTDPRVYGRTQRQKVRIGRARMLESATKILELYGTNSSMLEIEFFDEVGTGLGPTLEFYSNVSKLFALKSIRLWRDDDPLGSNSYVNSSNGLYPQPLPENILHIESGKAVLKHFFTLGAFVARSLIDGRLIDININSAFFASNEETDLMARLKMVDPALARTLSHIEAMCADTSKMAELDAYLDAISVDFTLPGYPEVELIHNGSSISVSSANAQLYIDKVLDFSVGGGVQHQFDSFIKGFNKVFPYEGMVAFTPQEISMLFSHDEEDWSYETLMECMKADHGYTLESATVQNFFNLLSGYSQQERRNFLQFTTGSPKLPIGGFKSLTPAFTIVCKQHEAPLTADDYLPSVMTCVNYLKLPNYSNSDVLRRRLQTAVEEGQGSFHLS